MSNTVKSLIVGLLLMLVGVPGFTQGRETRRVLGLFGELDAHNDVEVFNKLRAAAVELEQRVLGEERDAIDTQEAYLVACVLIAQQGRPGPADRDRAIALLERARSAVGQSVNPTYLSWADFSQASLLVGMGRLAEAEEILLESLQGPAPGSTNEMNIRHLMAEVLRAQSHWTDALAVLEESEWILQELDQEFPRDQASEDEIKLREAWWADLFSSRAQIEQGLGRMDLSAGALRKEREHAERSGDPFRRGVNLLNRCDFALATEDFGFVERSLSGLDLGRFDDALRPDQAAQFELYLGVARAELALEDRALFETARATLESVLGDPALPLREVFVAYRTLADLELHMGHFKRAADHISALRSRLEEAEGADQSTESVAVATLEARLAMDGPKGSLVSADVLGSMKDSWETSLEQWSRTPVSPGGVGFLHSSHRREVLCTLIRALVQVHGEETGVELGLDHLFEAEALGTLARRMDLPQADLASVRSAVLERDHGLLVFLPGREQTLVFGIDRSEVWMEEVPRWSALRDPIRSLQAGLRRSPMNLKGPAERIRHAGELEVAIARVSELLFPLAIQRRVSSWRRLSVLGTESLGRLSAGALRFDDGSLLGNRLAVDVLPSMTLGLAIAARTAQGVGPHGNSLVMLATLDPGPAAQAQWKHLVARRIAPNELNALTDPFRGSTQLIVGPELTRERLREVSMRGVGVLHFLAHGARLTDRERQAAILLSGTDNHIEVLTCEDVETELHPEGVVLLSVCSTARGPNRPGDDNLAHLGGAFLYAGAQAVVLAQSDVELGETMDLMKTVHEELAAGESAAEAVRKARSRIAAGADPLARYRGLAFEVIGLGQRSLSSTRPKRH